VKIKPFHLHIFFLSLIAVYIFSFHYLPLQDFPQWIYHGHVFNQMVFHGNDFGGYFSFHHYIPPNASATVLIGLLELPFSPMIAGKLFLFISMILLYAGSWRVLTTLARSDHLLFAVISFSCCFNLFFYGGFLNFLFGLGIALLGISYILDKRSNAALYLLMFFFLLCYLSHFASLLVLMVPVLSLILCDRNPKFVRKVLLALLPSLVIFIHYYFTKDLATLSPEGPGGQNYFYSLWGAISHFPSTVMPFHRIRSVLESSLLEYLTNYPFALFFIAGVMIFVVRALIKRDFSLLSTIGLITTVLVIFSPTYLGGLFSIGQRFVILLWFVVVVYYFLQFPAPGLHLLETVAAGFVALFSFVMLWYGTALLNGMDIPAHTDSRTHDARGGSNPFEHFHFYNDIEHNNGVPVFHSGLLDYKGAQNEKPFDQ